MYYRKLYGKAGDVHPVWYHGKAVCEQQGVLSNKEFKEKINDCTQNRADEDAAAAVRLIPNAVKVTRERRYIPDCSAVRGNLPKLPKFLKLPIA